MERKCPKCGGKLGIFDLKPNCPHCGCSIMYYDMDKRLEEDSIKAEAEWQKLDEILDKITPAFIKKKRAAREEKRKTKRIQAKNNPKAGAPAVILRAYRFLWEFATNFSKTVVNSTAIC